MFTLAFTRILTRSVQKAVWLRDEEFRARFAPIKPPHSNLGAGREAHSLLPSCHSASGLPGARSGAGSRRSAGSAMRGLSGARSQRCAQRTQRALLPGWGSVTNCNCERAQWQGCTRSTKALRCLLASQTTHVTIPHRFPQVCSTDAKQHFLCLFFFFC